MENEGAKSSWRKISIARSEALAYLRRNLKGGGQLPDTIERKSRLVTLVYQVLGTLELPPLDASEGEVLAALASAFQRKALVAVETERHARGKPALPKHTMFSPGPPSPRTGVLHAQPMRL